MKKATRESFGEVLKELVTEHEDVVVMDADLAEATKTLYAKKACPERFYDAGIAEANMVGMSAGLACSGLKPYVASFALFIAGRAFEQVRNSIGYPHLNVKLCGTHSGITVGEDGATHQSIEDIALMRTVPGMMVLQPCDDIETKQMFKALYDYEGPAYIRLSRYGVENVNDEHYSFKLDEIVEIHPGEKIALVATGVLVSKAKEAIEILKQSQIDVGLYNVHTIKPLNVTQLNAIASKYDKILVLEEHSRIGGLYSAICEQIHHKDIYSIAINDVFGESGTADDLLKKHGMTSQAIVEKVLEIKEK